MSPPSPSFFKRKLPESCISFASAEGKELFSKALQEGGMEAYFPLASQFVTQNEPAYCGLGTLVMILNALEIDPQRKWKGPWRWYEQEMLDCCRPLEAVAEVGITLVELACLARCNGLKATVISPNPSATTEERRQGIAKFRSDLKDAASKAQTIMALGYSRKSLGQTGDGHFSPVGGYCEERDSLLILDVARFKYPSYWVSVEQAWESMIPIDKATGQPRGYIQLSVLPENNPLSLDSTPSLTTLALNKSSWAAVGAALTKVILATKNSATAADLVGRVAQHISSLPTPILVARPTSTEALPGLVASLQSTQLYSLVSSSDPLSIFAILALFSSKSSLFRLLPSARLPEIERMVAEAMEIGGAQLQTEVEVLTSQLGALGECCRAEEEGSSCGCASVKTS